MTKKELRDYAKRYLLAALAALPVVIIVYLLLLQDSEIWLMVLVNMIIFGTAILICEILYQRRLKKIAALKANRVKNTLNKLKTDKQSKGEDINE